MTKSCPSRAIEMLEEIAEEIREEWIFTTDVLLAARVGPWEMHQDAEGLYLSDEWQAVFGIEVASEFFEDYLALLKPEEQPEFLERLEAAFRHGVHATFEFQHHLAGLLVLSRGRVVTAVRMVGADLVL